MAVHPRSRTTVGRFDEATDKKDYSLAGSTRYCCPGNIESSRFSAEEFHRVFLPTFMMQKATTGTMRITHSLFACAAKTQSLSALGVIRCATARSVYPHPPLFASLLPFREIRLMQVFRAATPPPVVKFLRDPIDLHYSLDFERETTKNRQGEFSLQGRRRAAISCDAHAPHLFALNVAVRSATFKWVVTNSGSGRALEALYVRYPTQSCRSANTCFPPFCDIPCVSQEGLVCVGLGGIGGMWPARMKRS
jgi:hypothetical protein